MKKKWQNTKAFSTLEYAATVVFVLVTLVAMKKPIARVFMGRWKTLGDTFMHGQQFDYDPDVTRECGRYVPISDPNVQPVVWGTPIWYNYRCYECCMDRIGPDTCPEGLMSAEDLVTCRNEADHLERRECCAEGCLDSACET